jgi:YfiH family protein
VARVRRIVTSRSGGVSKPPYESFNLGAHVGDDPAAVAANRGRLARAAKLEPDRLVWMQQVHGAAVATVDGPRPEPVPETDALVTATPGLALVVLVADCVPVLLAAPAAVAAVHAGRAGAAAGVVPAAVAAWVAAGADLAASDALLGPAVCGACYEVPAAMRDEVEAALPGSATTTRGGTPGLDLRAGLARQLTGLGVARVVLDPRCTAEDPTLFSHRRDGTTGRQAGLVWLG